MQRINTDTKAANLFGAGKHGFRAGDAQAGISPTQFSADWANALQEALCHPIEYSGLTLDGADHAQLTKGLRRLQRDWNPDLIGDPSTQTAGINTHTKFRSHSAGGAEPDTWLNRQATTRLINVTAGVHSMAFQIPQGAFFSGQVIVTYCRINTAQVGTFVTLFKGFRHFGAFTYGGGDELVNEGVTGLTNMYTNTNTIDSVLVEAEIAAGTWNFAAHWNVQLVTQYVAP